MADQTLQQEYYAVEIEESGGEGGIRTLSTGVSPYNGLAKHRVFFLRRVFNHLRFSQWKAIPVIQKVQ